LTDLLRYFWTASIRIFMGRIWMVALMNFTVYECASVIATSHVLMCMSLPCLLGGGSNQQEAGRGNDAPFVRLIGGRLLPGTEIPLFEGRPRILVSITNGRTYSPDPMLHI
jgi:hypothetical protein